MKYLTASFSDYMLKKAFFDYIEAYTTEMESRGNAYLLYDHTVKKQFDVILTNSEVIPWDEGILLVKQKLGELISLESAERLLKEVVSWADGRFMSFIDRKKITNFSLGSNKISEHRSDRSQNFPMSQGRFYSVKWKDYSMMKTTFDLAIYQMLLWELQPKTIIEIGAGLGGSAVWMSDIMTSYNLEHTIFSFDILPPKINHSKIHFIQADCNEIEQAVSLHQLKTLPHPWLVIEDAHVNVVGVLNHFHTFLEKGDYLVVEDSDSKELELGKFLINKSESYKVDTLYCDYFGVNVTCSCDSIFRRY